MPYVRNQSVKIFWDEHGSGSPVLLIMGLSFTHEMWFRVLPDLARRHRVIVFDNRGVGRSDVPAGPYLIRDMARDAVTVMNAAGVSSAQVIGASMGGMIAQELALRFPERVDSLLLGCTSHGGLLARWPCFTPRYSAPSLSEGATFRRSFVPWLYSSSTPRERVLEDIGVQRACNCSRKGCLNQFAGILLWSSFLRLPRISIPTLVTHGAEDRLIPHQNGRVVADRIPGAKFHLVPNAGHILTTDQTQICLDLMVDFLGRHDTHAPFDSGSRSEGARGRRGWGFH